MTAELGVVTYASLDLADNLLQSNRTSESLKDLRERTLITAVTKDPVGQWKLKDGLLTYQGRLVVAEDNNLRTQLIKEAHSQASTAHPGKNKTRKILTDWYYWPGMTTDIDRFIRNCYDCRRATIPRDKTPGLLQPLPIPERPWQHIS